MAAYRTPTAVVLTTEGVAYDTGRTHPLSPRLDLRNIGAVLDGAEKIFKGGVGVVLIGTDLADALTGLDKHPLDPRWKHPPLAPWTTFMAENGGFINLGLLNELEAKPGALGPLLNGHGGPSDLAWRLGRYNMLTGVPWTLTAGVSGCVGVRARFTDPQPGRQPLWHHPKTLRGLRGTGPLIWQHPEQPPAGAAGAVHVLDINAQYLAGLRNAQLAWGALKERTGLMFDPSWPGYWQVDVAGIPARLYDGLTQPPVFAKHLVHKGAAILTTEVVKYLTVRHGLSPDVHNAWVSENPHPIGRGFAEHLMAARSGGLGPMGPCTLAIKRTYAELVGMMAREGGSIWRPDWAATVMDLARINLLRRIDRLNHQEYRLLAVQADAVYVHGETTDRQEISRILGVGAGPGTFKYVRTLTVDAFRTQFRLAA